MRRFYFQNSIGERVDLQGNLFMHSPKGLGRSSKNEYASARSGFFANVDSEPEQMSFAGEIAILKDCYSAYQTLVNWLFAGLDVSIVYKPENIEYFADITIESLEKSEKSNGGILVIPISLKGRTPWYRALPKLLSLAPDDSSGCVLPYYLPYYLSAGGLENSADILAGGHTEASLYTELYGPVTSPHITLKNNADGEIIGQVTLSRTISDGETLVLSSVESETGIWVKSSSGALTDLIDEIDIAENPFFRVPQNTACTLTVTAASEIETEAQIKVYEYYWTV